MSVPEGPGLFLAHLEDGGRGQALIEHLICVSEGARKGSEKIGVGAAGTLIGLLHDLGKYSTDFQRYLRQMGADEDTEAPALARGMVDHSTAGAQTIWRSLKCKEGVDGVVGEILALCLASHHSGLIDCVAPSGLDNLSRRMRKPDVDSHYDEAWATAEPPVKEGIERALHDPELAQDRVDGKHYQIALRSLERGGRQDTFLGTRDCQGYVEPCRFGKGTGDYDGKGELGFGLMFHSFDYPDETGVNELAVNFWHSQMVDGVIQFPRPEACPFKNTIREMRPKAFGIGESLRPVDGY